MPIYTQSSVGTIVNAKEFPISSDNQQTYNTSFANVHYGAQVGEHRIIPVTELVTFDFTYLDLDKKIDESPNYDEMVTPLNNVQPNLSAEGLNIFFSTLNDSALNINDPNLLVLPTNTNINPNGNVTIFTFGAPLSSGSGQAQGVISAEETPESEELTEEPALQANLNIENTEPENETQFANASNKIPIANADFLTITENGLVAIDVIANDVTFNLNDDLTILSANIVNDNNNGSVTIDDNKILFDPQTNFDDLATGDESSVTINYTIADSQGSTAMNMVTLTIIGTNDAPIITGDITANIAEDTATVSGQLSITDVDSDEAAFNAETLAGTYGSLTLAADGQWTYALNNSLNAVQSLGNGDSLSDSFTVSSVDGTAQAITLTVTGTNDAPVISGQTSANIAEDTATVSGQLSITDVDTDEAAFNAETLNGNYGSLTVAEDGQWTYTLNNSLNAVQSLGNGDSLSDSFTVSSVDGTAQAITLTVTGTNDAPVIGGQTSANIAEDTATVSGQLSITDVDSDEAAFNAETLNGNYGSLTVAEDGQWTYTLDNNLAAVENLRDGEMLTDTISVTSIDGTSQAIDITITGKGPTAVPDVSATTENTSISIDTNNLISNDLSETNISLTDIDGSATIGDLTYIYNMAEVGSVNVDSNEITISLSNDFTNPVVFAFITTRNGTESAIARVDNVNSNSFDLKLVEPAGFDGSHTTETVSYMVLEAGVWQLADGTTIEVGTTSTANVIANSSDFDTVAFETDFTAPPVVFSQVQTSNNNFDFIKSRQADTTADQIEIGIEKYESNSSDFPGSTPETIAYFAVSAGSGQWSGNNFVVGQTTDSVTHTNYTQNFGLDLGSGELNFIGQLASFDGSDDSALRGVSTSSTQATFLVEEDISQDTELTHTTEIANYFVMAGNGILTAELISSSQPISTSQIASIDYDPGNNFDYLAAGETATDTFTYTITDEDGETDTATVTINLTGTNDNPVAVADVATTDEDNSVIINVLNNDTDIDVNDTLTITAASVVGAANGTVSIVNNQLVFDPGSDFDDLAPAQTRQVTINYTMSDGTASALSTVLVTVTGTNDIPTVVADTGGTFENTTLTFDVLANDSDIDSGDSFTLVNASIDGSNQGSVSIVNNQIVFDPGNDFELLDDGESSVVVINYTAEDSAGATNSSTLSITVSGEDDSLVISGTNNADTLTGAHDDDTITGRDGDDTIYGLGGNDELYGESGHDIIYGGEGDDYIDGGRGRDTIYGGEGDDIIDADRGQDIIYGGAGNDTVTGDRGADTYHYAGEGNDSFDGGTGTWIDAINLNGVNTLPGAGDWTLQIDNGVTYTIDAQNNTLEFDGSATGSISITGGGTLNFEEVEKITWTP